VSLEEVATLIEREHRLHQEWLGALSSLESFLLSANSPNLPEITSVLQDIMNQLSATQHEVMEKVSSYSLKLAAAQKKEQNPILEHILTLYENIDILQKKITQKHQDLRMFHPLQQPQPSSRPVQLALDNSMDLLKNLINLPH